MYTLWQAHNAQETEIEAIPDISSLNIPDLTGVQLTTHPAFVIRNNNNSTDVGIQLRFTIADGNSPFEIIFDPVGNKVHFAPGGTNPTFVFHGTVEADNIPNN